MRAPRSRKSGPKGDEAVPGTVDALEIALGQEQADPDPDSPARRVLIKHERLLDQQIGLARNERFRNRIKSARDLSLALIAVLIALGGVSFVWSAVEADGLVVEPLSVPPDLAARGLTGEVVAAKLLDKMLVIGNDSNSWRAGSNLRRDWGEDLRVEVPQTGVSIGDAQRWLRRRLGNETLVRGEVVHMAGGLAVTARAANMPGDTRLGTIADLDKLLTETAEHLLKRTQPFQFAAYLRNQERFEEARAAAAALSRFGPDEERAWANVLLTYIAYRQGDLAGSLAAAATARRLNPELPVGHLAFSSSALLLERREAALDALMEARRTGRRSLEAVAPDLRERFSLTAERLAADLTGDRQGAMRALAGDVASDALAIRAEQMALNHDVSGSKALLANGALGASDSERLRYVIYGDLFLPDYEQARALDRWSEALASIEATDAAARAALPRAAIMNVVRLRQLAPRRAVALARLGRHAEAEAIAQILPADCYRCLLARAEIAELAGKRGLADRWFEAAVRSGPSLPFAHQAWGMAKAARGETEGAAAAFEAAIRKGPNWSDPHKGEADMLARQGRLKAAIRRYRMAARLSPRWGALHLEWGKALWQSGQREEARTRLRAAAGMDLTPADRARLQRIWGAVG
jgi:tetratricopeptide (TPR) repeat protein